LLYQSPGLSLRDGIDGIIQSILASQHLLEMFRRGGFTAGYQSVRRFVGKLQGSLKAEQADSSLLRHRKTIT
jgi:hypothetical protein